MVRFLRIHLAVVLLILLAQCVVKAQNCTINAGVNQTLCEGTSFTLIGTGNGNFTDLPKWTQIAGPAVTLSASTIANGQVTANVTGYTKGIAYTFRLSAKCTDGTPVSDDAIYIFSPLTVASAGPPVTSCPGVITMAANAVKPGETGTWQVINGNLPLPSPVNDPHATVTLPTTGNGVGTTIFRWKITDGTCTSTSDVAVTDIGGVTPVTASGPGATVACYTSFASTNISGSYPGTGNGQMGTWSFISGPSTPVFGDIHNNNTTLGNLQGGTYVVRWTVSGPCVNGSADVTIQVAPPSQDVTQAGGTTSNYCDNRTSTVLNGVRPLYANETVLWTQAAGPAGATIVSPTSPSTAINGLLPPNQYDFNYTITNSVTNCSSTGTYRIRYINPPQFVTFPVSPVVLPTDTLQYNVVYSTSGGNLLQFALVNSPAGSKVLDSIGLNNYLNAGATSELVRGMDKPGNYIYRFKLSNNNATGGCEDVYKDISIIVSRKPYDSNAGTSQFLACGSTTATLAGNAPTAGDNGQGTWTQISGPSIAAIQDIHSNTTTVSNLVSGVYIFRWIISAGNNVQDNTESIVHIIVASPPTTVDAGADVGTCYGTPIKLNGNQPKDEETGTWSVVSETPAIPASTITFSDIHDPQAIANGFRPFKVYKLQWTISNTCGSIADTVSINTTVTDGPQQAVAGPDQCLASGTSSFNLAANAPSADETGTWTLLPGAPNTPIYSTTASSQTVTGAVNGRYTFEWKLDKGGCTSSRDTVEITISAPTTAATIAGAPLQSVCGSTTITLNGNTPAATEAGLWTQTGGLGGAVITSPNSATTTVTGLGDGAYKFTWTISNGSCSSSSADITYNVNQAATIANAGPNQNICDVNTTTLAANPIVVGSGVWSVVSGPNTPRFTDITDPHTIISGLVLGTYTLTWTATNGTICPPSSSNVSITVGLSANAGPDQNLCNTTITVLSGNEGTTGTWTEISGPSTVTLTPNSNNTSEVTGLIPGTYVFRYTVTVGGCGNLTDDVTVNVSGPPSTADAGPDQNLCTSAGTTVTLTAATPTVGTGMWSIDSEPGGANATIASAATPSTAVNNLSVPGVYILRWTVSANSCTGMQSSNDIVRIEVSLPPTTAQAMAAQPTDCTSSVILTGTTPTVGIGTWTLVSGPSTPTIDAPNSPTTTISNITASTTPYIFRWTITNGSCAPSSADVNITVIDNTPALAAAGTVADKCTPAVGGNTSVNLASTNVLTGNDQGTWTVVIQPASSPAVAFSDIHSPTAIASGLVAGEYNFKWTITNLSSCTSADTAGFRIYDPPSTADAGPPTSGYCLYAPVVLAATAPTTGIGTWTVVSMPTGAATPVFSSVNDPHATVTGLVQGDYDLRWTTSNGPCVTSQDDIIITINDCQIAIAKDNPNTPVLQPDGSFNVTFVFHVKNTGTVAVNNVQVVDNLITTFPSPKTFTKVSIATTGALTANNNFNGNSDTNLLTAGSSSLASGVEQTVTLVVNVKLN
ncbi:PKD domain-containing protein [Mucilaginibacter agri]|uniref:DUF11 domain-containing protein n=1 Tax=Mucilaginibacter agri TaxID=2695265 RepID=A0A966DWB8_9SPHI|nr:hypothetical protein [Mucilaginibacter agri]NCD72371.1 hypothetical protein [Mucilaginibacter agri]